jgi:hypothetical protein
LCAAGGILLDRRPIACLGSFVRELQPVELAGSSADSVTIRVTLCVMPDYLSIGSDSDFLLAPMRLSTAVEVAGIMGFTLPTATIVDAIYANCTYRLTPQPLPASSEMRSTGYFVTHDGMIRAQREQIAAAPGGLIAGHKKDLVLTQRLWDNLERIAIYGWHNSDGHPIQPLSTVHGWHYVDYSHGVRLVSDQVLVNGEQRSLRDVLQDSSIARILNREGVIVGLNELMVRLAQSPGPLPVHGDAVRRFCSNETRGDSSHGCAGP